MVDFHDYPATNDISSNDNSKYSLTIQRKRCAHDDCKHYPNPCLSCLQAVGKNDHETCRFRNIRAFKQRGKKTVEWCFVSSKSLGIPLKILPSMNIPLMTKEQRQYVRETIRPTVKRLLDREIDWMNKTEGRYRRRLPSTNARHTCDYCLTSIFNVHFMCSICGVDRCVGCYDESTYWNSSNTDNGTDLNNDNDDDPTICTLGRRHTKDQFIPIVKYNLNTLWSLRLQTSMNLPSKCFISSSPITNHPVYASHSASSPSSSPIMTPASLSFTSNTSPPWPSQRKSNNHLVYYHHLSSQLNICNGLDSSYQEQQQKQLLVISQKDITLDIFQHYWRKGKPAIIQDVMELSKTDWSPQTFCSLYGNDMIEAIDCHTMKVNNMKIKDFFKGYMDHQKKPVLKIKDWPPQSEFAKVCPRWYEDFMSMLPMNEYCGVNGVFNLSNRLPQEFIKPDLGPKMFIAYGLDFTDGMTTVGTTNLHCDMTDAVNVMCHSQPMDINANNNKKYDIGVSSSPGPAAAVWDVFAFDDLPVLRQFLTQLLREKGESFVEPSMMSKSVRPRPSSPSHTAHFLYSTPTSSSSTPTLAPSSSSPGSSSSSPLPSSSSTPTSSSPSELKQSTIISSEKKTKDPVHSQWIYLTEDLLERLKREYGIQSWRIYQNPGDAVYIPAGCAHQVANYQSAIKCAYDFISPENIERSATITRQLAKARQEDVLQLHSTLLYSWISTYRRPTTTSSLIKIKSEEEEEEEEDDDDDERSFLDTKKRKKKKISNLTMKSETDCTSHGNQNGRKKKGRKPKNDNLECNQG
ncbi:uncharacterized protein BX664DRAFT_344211 [Halteromyces radiatus]|uniref:uncharacterized protein n=1 Tax=Halteromyces radiatus TaxID=101107 RepID=UPI00221F48AF|nr:uncharacterized protein BX664DRAFT_344211 [Halteromyces radiatus]KAI8076902.1 hypothetical protein BX664DRAFT_344211 [Halteromyces radiatus]